MTHISTETLAAGDAVQADADAAVSLKGVARRFGDVVAVERLDLDLKVGEFFSIIGPSGCGKTTTLRMVGGFELPSTGKIYLDGRDVTFLPPHKRDINTVFQSYALFPHLTIFDNVAFGLRRKGIGRDETRRRVNEHLELVGLNGFGQRRPNQISGGQQQRVALARALVNHPKVLLLDEPMGALDARIRKTMQGELKRIQREVGITFLYVTHDQAEAMSMSDRLAVMHAGRCEDLGAPERVYDRPGSRFVANFLGNCNFLDLENDHGQLRLPDGTPVVIDSAHGATSGQLGIRPEKLVISRTVHADSATTANRITATVTEATYLGASSEFQLSTSWGGTLMVFAQNIADSARVRPGEQVEVGWDPQHGFLVPETATEPVADAA